MSYAEMDFATVPAAPPAWKKWRATSWPAPISANVPYFGSSRLIARALRFVVASSDDSMGSLIERTSSAFGIAVLSQLAIAFASRSPRQEEESVSVEEECHRQSPWIQSTVKSVQFQPKEFVAGDLLPF